MILSLCLAQKDSISKKYIINFIHHRLNQRYIVPLLHVPTVFKSGFLMMASGCLLIETMQSFYDGKQETKGESEKTFKNFFKRERAIFPDFLEHNHEFYVNVRCGILHQAETRGGYRILRIGPLFDVGAKSINANRFLEGLKQSLDGYVEKLYASRDNDPLWINAQAKVMFISENCMSSVL